MKLRKGPKITIKRIISLNYVVAKELICLPVDTMSHAKHTHHKYMQSSYAPRDFVSTNHKARVSLVAIV